MTQIMAMFYGLLFLALALLPAYELTRYFLRMGRYDRRRAPDRRTQPRDYGPERRASRYSH